MQDANENSPNERLAGAEPQSIPAFSPTPDNPPWGSVVAFLAWVASVVLIALIPTLFLLPYVLSSGPAFSESQELGSFLQRDATAIILQIVAIIPAHIVTIVLAWLIVTKQNRFSFTETLGWRSGGMRWIHYLAILVVFFAIAGVVGNYFPEQDNELTRILKSSRPAVFLVAFMATFTAPLVEEVIYRGILYSAFQRTFGVASAIAAVTFLFALVHVPQYYPSYSTIFLLVVPSLTLTVIRATTGNLLPCIVLHTIFNATQSLLLILEPYLKTQAPVIEPAAILLLK